MRAGGAEWEMWPSEMGELELSTGDRDAAAAGGEAGWSCPSTAVPRVSLCKCRACTRSKEDTFPKKFSLAAFKRALVSGEEQIPAGFCLFLVLPWDLGAPGLQPFLKKPLSFITRSQTPSPPSKNQCGGTINGVKAKAYEGMQAALCNHSIFLCSDRVKLQKQLRGLDIFDHICSCSCCN